MRIPQIKYRATFADGVVRARLTDRTYTHAWRAGDRFGFSGSKELAHKGAAQVAAWTKAGIEVVAVEILNPEVLPIREKMLEEAKAKVEGYSERHARSPLPYPTDGIWRDA